jgi:two-component sensor histidine kinase
VRNVLTMVRAVAQRTVAGGGTPQEIGGRLGGRIDALARTQSLLTRALGVGVDFEKLVRDELLAQAADLTALSISGPPLELSPKAAEVMTLAIHELAANATKYGALAHDAGKVVATWSFREEAGSQWLLFEWVESGVDLTGRLGAPAGFGTELITRRVPYELNGRGEVQLRAGGVRCTIEFPLVRGEGLLQTASPPK